MNQNCHACASVTVTGECTRRYEGPAATEYGPTELHAQEMPPSATSSELPSMSHAHSIAAVNAPTWPTAITTATGVPGPDIPSPLSGPPVAGAASMSPPVDTRPWNNPHSHGTQPSAPRALLQLRPALSLPLGLTHNVAAGVGAEDDTAATSPVAVRTASASASNLPPSLEVYVRGQHTVQGARASVHALTPSLATCPKVVHKEIPYAWLHTTAAVGR